MGKIEDEIPQIPDKSFDYVVSLSSLHFVEDLIVILSEFGRIAKKGWLISLAHITSNYSKHFPVDKPMYNQTKISLPYMQEDIYFPAWKSVTTEDTINERMIFSKIF